jgi:hypothetical protein
VAQRDVRAAHERAQPPQQRREVVARAAGERARPLDDRQVRQQVAADRDRQPPHRRRPPRLRLRRR